MLCRPTKPICIITPEAQGAPNAGRCDDGLSDLGLHTAVKAQLGLQLCALFGAQLQPLFLRPQDAESQGHSCPCVYLYS